MSAVLNMNRNPDKSREDIEQELHKLLGVNNFLWLIGVRKDDDVQWTDDTDMHVDILARFVNETTIVYSSEKDESDAFYPILHRTEQELRKYASKKGFILVPLPMPKNGVYSVSHIGGGGNLLNSNDRSRTIASYTNFYIANKVVLMPAYGNVNDEVARKTLQELFPHRDVIPVNVVDLVENGGEIHCVTQQQPEIK
jgi:agmatine deiminase